MIEGNFIVIEGIDGAGTTTQVARLVDAFRERGLPAHGTREPSDGPFGMMIRQALSGRLVVPGTHGGFAPGWDTLALLFASDRLDHLEAEVIPNLMDGVTVVSDRYDHSSVAYQSVSSGDADTVEWIKAINGRARRPDLTLVLDVSPEVAAKRRDGRGGTRELYEVDELQRSLAEFYAKIDEHFPGDRIVHIDGDGDADAVAAAVLAEVDAFRNGG